MAKALMGSFTTPDTLRLLEEIRALRQRVAELESALAEAERARDDRELRVSLDPVDDTGEREAAAGDDGDAPAGDDHVVSLDPAESVTA